MPLAINGVKVCARCTEQLPTSDFRKDAQKGDGLRSYCRKCHNKDARAYQIANREKHWEHTKAWREKNKEAYLAARNAWAKTERGVATTRAWYEKNREKVNLTNRVRRAMRRGMRAKVTVEHVGRLMSLQKGRCAACHVDLKGGYHIDHILPLALGGDNATTNLQLLCPTCNCSKGAKHPVDFMQRIGRLL